LFNGLFGPRNQDPCLHDIANHRRGRIFDYESNIPRKVSLGDDAKEYLSITTNEPMFLSAIFAMASITVASG